MCFYGPAKHAIVMSQVSLKGVMNHQFTVNVRLMLWHIFPGEVFTQVQAVELCLKPTELPSGFQQGQGQLHRPLLIRQCWQTDKILPLRVEGALALVKLKLIRSCCVQGSIRERNTSLIQQQVCFFYVRGSGQEILMSWELSKRQSESRALVCHSGRCCFCEQQA